ncbi:MAG: hypothetical protein JST19_10440 [Bacteroidetes bacterium]|nr:hypothetical protein [Bacteroidota bacterium]
MLSNVSWGQYLTGVGVLLVIYYLVVAGLFRKDAVAFLSKLRKKGGAAKTGQAGSSGNLTVEQLEAIVGDLRTKVFLPMGHSASKEQILSSLQKELTGYPGIHRKAYRYALGNAIMQIAAETCAIQIDEKELNTLWDKI